MSKAVTAAAVQYSLLLPSVIIYRRNLSLFPYELLPLVVAMLHYFVVILPSAVRAARDARPPEFEIFRWLALALSVLSPLVLYVLQDRLSR